MIGLCKIEIAIIPLVDADLGRGDSKEFPVCEMGLGHHNLVVGKRHYGITVFLVYSLYLLGSHLPIGDSCMNVQICLIKITAVG